MILAEWTNTDTPRRVVLRSGGQVVITASDGTQAAPEGDTSESRTVATPMPPDKTLIRLLTVLAGVGEHEDPDFILTLESASQRALVLTARLLVTLRDPKAHATLDLAASTGDGGLSFEFLGPSGRELLFVVPQDGARLYFVARSPRPPKKAAGIVTDPRTSLGGLARWLRSDDEPLPEAGIQLG